MGFWVTESENFPVSRPTAGLPCAIVRPVEQCQEVQSWQTIGSQSMVGRRSSSEPLPDGVSGPSVIGDEEIAAVTEVLRSQELFRYPKEQSEAAKFEEEVAEYLGVEYALMVNSGTSALITALTGVGAGTGRRGHRSWIHVHRHGRRSDGHRRRARDSGGRRVSGTRSAVISSEDYAVHQGCRARPHARRSRAN